MLCEYRGARRDETAMVALQSNADAILVAIPMVALMFAGFFRLDALFSRPPKRPSRYHPLSHWDEDGLLVCVEPDGAWERGKGETRRELSETLGRPVHGSDFGRPPFSVDQDDPEDFPI